MSSDWRSAQLGDVCDFAAGSAFKPEAQGSLAGDYPFVKVSDMNLPGNEIAFTRANNFVTEEVRKSLKAKLHPSGATVFAKIGVALTTNRRRLLTRPTIIDNNLMAAIPKRTLITDHFLYYLLTTIDFNTIAAGTALPYLNVSDLRKIEVEIPPLDAQHAIACSLKGIDDRITLLRETNATLEAIAQALFKSWFVDFDPVRAKMSGRAPEGMDEATAALFPDSFEDSELGEVPRGWEVRPIGDCIETVGGATPDTKTAAYWEPAEHAWTTPKDLSGATAPVLIETERKLSASGLAKVSSGLLPVGSLLMSSRAPIGYLAITDLPVAVNQGYIGMPPGGRLPPLYMLRWCEANMEQIKGRANGSTFMEISKKAFRPIPAVVPSAEVLRAFQSIAEPLFHRVIANERQAMSLSTLRDTLLPRLISGQLRLPAGSVALEEALA